MRFDLAQGFPLLTTKKVAFKNIVNELLWFIAGDNSLRTLTLQGNNIWNEWPYKAFLEENGMPVPDQKSAEWKEGMAEFVRRINEDDEFNAKYGDLGPIYGKQWREWKTARGQVIDQLKESVEMLTKSPSSRRNLVVAWNPGEVDEMSKRALPPCHCLFQFDVTDGKLSCQLYQRSADYFLGVPFNIASYALLTQMMAHVAGLKLGDFIWTGGNTHFYVDHIEQIELQMSREPFPMPRIELDPSVTNLFDFRTEHIKLVGYESHPAIKGEIAI
jgi:thymidylate synthase